MSTNLPWYALKVASRHELATEKELRSLGYEAACPWVEGRRRSASGIPRPFRYPLFTGYVFAAFPDPAVGLDALLAKRNKPSAKVVLGFVGGSEPATLRTADVEYLHSISDGKYRPGPYLVVGDCVLVPDGLLRGRRSTIVEIRSGIRATLVVKGEKNAIRLERPLDQLVKL